MKHLMNILAGMGQVMGLLGSAPRYTYPRIGDRARDLRHLSGDALQVSRRLDRVAAQELQRLQHGQQVHHRPTAK